MKRLLSLLTIVLIGLIYLNISYSQNNSNGNNTNDLNKEVVVYENIFDVKIEVGNLAEKKEKMLSMLRSWDSQYSVLKGVGSSVVMTITELQLSELKSNGFEVEVRKTGTRIQSQKSQNSEGSLLQKQAGITTTGSQYGYNGSVYPIPDNGTWLTRDISISGAPSDARVTTVTVYFDITHTRSTDLVVEFRDNNGKIKTLFNRESASSPIQRTYPGINDFYGTTVNHTWTLAMKDVVPGVSGGFTLCTLDVFWETPPDPPYLNFPMNGSWEKTLPISVSWSSVTGATEYTVQVADNTDFTLPIVNGPTSSTSYGLPPLTSGKTYFWHVKAKNAAGYGNYNSTPYSFLYRVDTPTLISPPDKSVQNASPVNLNWFSIFSATIYEVQVALDVNFNSIIATGSPTMPGFSYPPAYNSTTYYWRVRAGNSSGWSSWSTVWSFFYQLPPPAPFLSVPTNGSTQLTRSVSLGWNSVTSATEYGVQVANNPGFTSPIVDQSTGSSTSFTIPTGQLVFGTTYYWRARAKNAGGWGSYASAWSFIYRPQVTVHGNAFYYDQSCNPHPIRYALIRIMDDDGSPEGRVLPNIPSGNVYTDEYGRYSATVEDDEAGGLDIFVNVCAIGGDKAYKNSTSQITTILRRSDNKLNIKPSGTYFDNTLSDLLIPDIIDDKVASTTPPINTGGAFAVYDAIVTGFTKLYDKFGVEFVAPTTYFPDPGDAGGGCYFHPTYGTIHIVQDAQWDKDVILHEYGHKVEKEYNFAQGPVGTDGGHSWNVDLTQVPITRTPEQAMNLAFKESWATFFSIVIQYDPTAPDSTYDDTRPGNVMHLNLEDDTQLKSGISYYGEYNEAMTTCSLWDMFDVNTRSYDANESLRLNYSTSKPDMWKASSVETQRPTTFQDYFYRLKDVIQRDRPTEYPTDNLQLTTIHINHLMHFPTNGIGGEIVISELTNPVSENCSAHYASTYYDNGDGSHVVSWTWKIKLYHTSGIYTLVTYTTTSSGTWNLTVPAIPSESEGYTWLRNSDGSIQSGVSVRVLDSDGYFHEDSRDICVNEVTYVGGTICENTTWSGSIVVNDDVMIGNGALYGCDPTLTITPGTTIYIMQGKKITVSQYSKVLANGTQGSSIQFRKYNDNLNAWDRIILKGNDNQFSWCVFDGGNANVDIRSMGTTFTSCAFRHGGRGINTDYMGTGRSTFSLDNCVVENNIGDGIYLYESNPTINQSTIKNNSGTGLYLTNSTVSVFTNNVVSNNGGYGIYVNPGSIFYMGNGGGWHSLKYPETIPPDGAGKDSIANNGWCEIYTEYGAQFCAGQYWAWAMLLKDGYNKISSNGLYICNVAYTRENESGVQYYYSDVYANKIRWGELNEADPEKFSGSVDYYYPLTFNPIGTPGAGSGTVPNLKISNPTSESNPATVLTASVAEKLTEQTVETSQKQFIVDLKNKMLEKRTKVSDPDNSYYCAKLLGIHNMLRVFDPNDMTKEIGAVNVLLSEYRARLLSNQSTNPIERLCSEAALVNEVQEEIQNGELTQAQEHIKQYMPYIQNKDNKRVILFAEFSVNERLGNYVKAWEALQKVKAIEPDADRKKVSMAPSYSSLERMLLEKAKAAGVALSEGQMTELQQMPNRIELSQNYPNPFNPTTVMSYQLPVTSYVSLKVYDMLGRAVAVLQDGMKEAGTWTATFDASKLSSGIYFSRLTVKPQEGNAVVQVKKMLLVK